MPTGTSSSLPSSGRADGITGVKSFTGAAPEVGIRRPVDERHCHAGASSLPAFSCRSEFPSLNGRFYGAQHCSRISESVNASNTPVVTNTDVQDEKSIKHNIVRSVRITRRSHFRRAIGLLSKDARPEEEHRQKKSSHFPNLPPLLRTLSRTCRGRGAARDGWIDPLALPRQEFLVPGAIPARPRSFELPAR
jgi:hypothetical protein